MEEATTHRAENGRLRALLLKVYPYVPQSAGSPELQEELERAVMGEGYRDRQARAALVWCAGPLADLRRQLQGQARSRLKQDLL